MSPGTMMDDYLSDLLHAAPAVAHAPASASAPAAAIVPQPAAVALPQPPSRRQDDEKRNRRAGERSSRWLRLRCDAQSYGLELMKVQEVMLPGLLVPLRGAPRHMLGLINLRGQIVPVVDLGVYLQREAIPVDAAARIVVIEEKGDTLGLRVSSVEDVVSLTEKQIEAADTTRTACMTSKVCRGVARVGGRALILLDASHLLQ